MVGAWLLGLLLFSGSFIPGGTMPAGLVYDRAGCHGANRSPELHWSGVPAGTKSFALVLHDPDAPAPGGWYHWVVYDLPAQTRELPQGAHLPASELGRTSWGEAGYGGPCPPPGKPHRYVFTLYALDVARIPKPPAGGPQLERAVRGHVLGVATLIGRYKNPASHAERHRRE